MSEEFAEQKEDPTPQNDEFTEPVEGAREEECPECQNDADKIASLELKLAALNDQYLRKAADFENFRKRMNREKQEAIDFANQTLLLDLIPVIDDFERAIKAAETVLAKDTSPDFKNLYDGISMTEKRLLTQLENRWGLKRFDSAGEVFDPNRHEAIMMDKSTDIAEPVVQEDFLKGYTLKEKVIRCAQVKVLMPGAPADSANSQSNEAENTGDENAGGKDTVKEESK
jgi:molecular chaperone GrpE